MYIYHSFLQTVELHIVWKLNVRLVTTPSVKYVTSFTYNAYKENKIKKFATPLNSDTVRTFK